MQGISLGHGAGATGGYRSQHRSVPAGRQGRLEQQRTGGTPQFGVPPVRSRIRSSYVVGRPCVRVWASFVTQNLEAALPAFGSR